MEDDWWILWSLVQRNTVTRFHRLVESYDSWCVWGFAHKSEITCSNPDRLT